MQQLETTKGKSVVIPKLVNRYIIMFYDISLGWRVEFEVFTNPESAIQWFIEQKSRYVNDNIKFYKVVEVELEVPFVPKT